MKTKEYLPAQNRRGDDAERDHIPTVKSAKEQIENGFISLHPLIAPNRVVAMILVSVAAVKAEDGEGFTKR